MRLSVYSNVAASLNFQERLELARLVSDISDELQHAVASAATMAISRSKYSIADPTARTMWVIDESGLPIEGAAVLTRRRITRITDRAVRIYEPFTITNRLTPKPRSGPIHGGNKGIAHLPRCKHRAALQAPGRDRLARAYRMQRRSSCVIAASSPCFFRKTPDCPTSRMRKKGSWWNCVERSLKNICRPLNS
jgi:hypothetical protein